MKTHEEIEARRDELEAMMSKVGYTDEINAEWKALYNDEMMLDIENAEAIAKDNDVIVFIKDMYECGYAINTKINGEWNYDEHTYAVDAMKKFAELARKHGVKKCLVSPKWLDRDYLEELDRKASAWRNEEEYADACMASAYGDDSLMERYNRKHGIEKEYSPSNPWDAPGMSVRDFI